MTWRGEASDDGTHLVVDDFSVDDQFTTKVEFRDAAGEKWAEGTTLIRPVTSGSATD